MGLGDISTRLPSAAIGDSGSGAAGVLVAVSAASEPSRSGVAVDATFVTAAGRLGESASIGWWVAGGVGASNASPSDHGPRRLGDSSGGR